MVPAAYLEWAEPPGRRHPQLADVVDDRRGRSGAEELEQHVEAVARAFRDAPDRTVPGVRDPAVEAEVHRLAQDEIAEADALDPSPNGGVEPRGRCLGEQRSTVRRPRCATARRGPARRARARARRSRPAALPIERRGPGTPPPSQAGWRPRSPSVRRA